MRWIWVMVRRLSRASRAKRAPVITCMVMVPRPKQVPTRAAHQTLGIWGARRKTMMTAKPPNPQPATKPWSRAMRSGTGLIPPCPSSATFRGSAAVVW